MRYTSDHRQQTHQRILEAAARLFRERGYSATGVDAVMETAGLTAGGFYSHFKSKEALLSEAVGVALEGVRERLLEGLEDCQADGWLREVVGRYLSQAHRDAVANGCPLPALAAEVSRSSKRARQTFETQLKKLLTEFERRVPGGSEAERDRVLAIVALCVGGLMLSRAVNDRVLSDRFLDACRRLAVPEDSHE